MMRYFLLIRFLIVISTEISSIKSEVITSKNHQIVIEKIINLKINVNEFCADDLSGIYRNGSKIHEGEHQNVFLAV